MRLTQSHGQLCMVGRPSSTHNDKAPARQQNAGFDVCPLQVPGLAGLYYCHTTEGHAAHSPHKPVQTAGGLHISSDSHFTGGSPGTQPSEQSSVPSIHFMVRILSP